jgi:hypothetical protein
LRIAPVGVATAVRGLEFSYNAAAALNDEQVRSLEIEA